MKKTVIKTIKLTLPKGEIFLHGIEMGQKFRAKYSLDELEKKPGIVNVRILPDMVSSSFIRGMFTKSIERFGNTGFFQKYRFVEVADS